MLRYEHTAKGSLSLARALLEEDPELLSKFDRAAAVHNIENLVVKNGDAARLKPNRDEAVVELKWLKSYLESVRERASVLGHTFKIVAPRIEQAENGINVEQDSEKFALKLADQSGGYGEVFEPRQPGRQFVPPGPERIDLDAHDGWRRRLSDRRKQAENAERVAMLNSRKVQATREEHLNGRARRAQQSRKAESTRKRLEEKPEKHKRSPKEELWCVCQRPSSGLMFACDNDSCPYQWFHATCMDLRAAPRGTWYCPVCAPAMARQQRRSSRVEKKRR